MESKISFDSQDTSTAVLDSEYILNYFTQFSKYALDGIPSYLGVNKST